MPKCTSLLFLFCWETPFRCFQRKIVCSDVIWYWIWLIWLFSETPWLKKPSIFALIYMNAFEACEDFCHCCSCFQQSWDKMLFLYLWVWIIYSDSLANASALWLHWVNKIRSDIQRCCLLIIVWSIQMKKITYQHSHSFINWYPFTEFTDNLPRQGDNL